MSELDDIIIDRKKPLAAYLGFFFLPILFLFHIAFLIAPFMAKSVIEAIITLPLWLFFLLTPKLVRSIRISIDKLRSKNPEFRISKNAIHFYDYYLIDSIPFDDIKRIKIVIPPKSGSTLAITLSNSSNVPSNTNYFQNQRFNGNSSQTKFVMYNLNWAKIDSNKLLELIQRRIQENRKA